MAVMQCNETIRIADEWLAGQRAAETREHVAACVTCRAFLADLEAIAPVARQLGADEQEAPERLWVSLRAQLEAEGLIREQVAAEQPAAVMARCSETIHIAEEWLDAQPSAQTREHVAVCVTCRAFVADLEAIAPVARELGAEEQEAPERLWVSLRAQLEAEGLIHEQVAGEQPALSSGWSELFTGFTSLFRRPVLAATYAAAVLAAVLMLPATETLIGSGEPRMHLGIRSMEQQARQATPALAAKNPDVASIYRDNLAIVDNFIALCEKSVRENPDDTIAREYLLQAMQQKADLLTTVAERGLGD